MKEQIYRDKISAFIEGDLSAYELKEFETYIVENPSFAEEVNEIRVLINNLSNIETVNTSTHFINNLNTKIDNYESSIWDKFINFNIFKENYLSAVGITAALLIVVSSSYIFLHQTNTTNIDINNISNQQTISKDTTGFASDNDNRDSSKSNTNIRLVGGKE